MSNTLDNVIPTDAELDSVGTPDNISNEDIKYEERPVFVGKVLCHVTQAKWIKTKGLKILFVFETDGEVLDNQSNIHPSGTTMSDFVTVRADSSYPEATQTIMIDIGRQTLARTYLAAKGKSFSTLTETAIDNLIAELVEEGGKAEHKSTVKNGSVRFIIGKPIVQSLTAPPNKKTGVPQQRFSARAVRS